MDTVGEKCVLCGEQPLVVHTLPHLASCYYNYMVKNNMEPFCTNHCCKGLRTHPSSDENDNNNTEMRRNIPSGTKRKSTDSSVEPDPLDCDQLVGKRCIECALARGGGKKDLPIISLGKYRTLKICKKGHLKAEAEKRDIIKTIQRELENVKQNGDVSMESYLANSHDDSQSSPLEQNRKCGGYVKLQGRGLSEEQCTTDCTSLLSIPRPHKPEEKVYFCHANHLVRFLQKYHLGGRGGTNSTATRK